MHPLPSERVEAVLSELQRCLIRPLPGLEAQKHMAPAYRAKPEHILVDGKNCRPAAVLIPLFPTPEGWATVLTLRRATLSTHAGQISFPGGRQDPDETLEEAALREVHEEIHLNAEEIVSLHPLSPLYIPPTHYCVYPFVALLRKQPAFHPNTDEVEALLIVPLKALFDPHNTQSEQWEIRGRQVQVPFFNIHGHTIWGATAMILSELLALLRPCKAMLQAVPDAPEP